MQNWEGGDSSLPRPALLRSLAAVLRVAPQYLLGQSEPQDTNVDEARRGATATDTPAWLEDLGQRLKEHDEGRRRRILLVVHALLDLMANDPTSDDAQETEHHQIEIPAGRSKDPEVQKAYQSIVREVIARHQNRPDTGRSDTGVSQDR